MPRRKGPEYVEYYTPGMYEYISKPQRGVIMADEPEVVRPDRIDLRDEIVHVLEMNSALCMDDPVDRKMLASILFAHVEGFYDGL